MIHSILFVAIMLSGYAAAILFACAVGLVVLGGLELVAVFLRWAEWAIIAMAVLCLAYFLI